MDLQGKTAVVTGGASGIGLAVARAFVQKGAKVLIADVNEAGLKAAVEGLRTAGGRAEAMVCNVAKEADCEALAARAVERFGALDVAVLSAGILRDGLLIRVDKETKKRPDYIRGLPFPNIDPNDPDAGYKALWNRDSFDNAGATLISTVHYGSSYANAYWDGTQMVYGDGDSTQGCAPLALGLDVTAHELTHAVTEHESNLTYSGESGGLNEAMSDIFGEFVEVGLDRPRDFRIAVSTHRLAIRVVRINERRIELHAGEAGAQGGQSRFHTPGHFQSVDPGQFLHDQQEIGAVLDDRIANRVAGILARDLERDP